MSLRQLCEFKKYAVFAPCDQLASVKAYGICTERRIELTCRPIFLTDNSLHHVFEVFWYKFIFHISERLKGYCVRL